MKESDVEDDEVLVDPGEDYITIDVSTMNSTYAYDINSNWTSIDNSVLSSGDIWISNEPTKTVINTPLEVNGRDILAELDEMRDALILIKRDVNMEEKYPELKRLKDEYEAALEKYKTFDAIKESK